ncbi:pyridoxamine 5'-phosphate oxidase family protein [Streptomyces sp. XM4193]|uniref:pyridoxamine 5'-phosphate oxidase family protein n=1 Tax=Streptomyces sp. XM4193 TaxID=2929782 RepID=UPI001FF95B51|nr:pyridoxamine 5'-phosphate oxidase family protein [Streptomyces sp. XM4193]MCK1794545.1 pyridoxamine 5'-phosphate oxidase family protein [Streptomyces sp. XM4193]
MRGAERRLAEISGAEALWLLAGSRSGRLVYTRRGATVLRPAAHLLEYGRLIVRAPAPEEIAETDAEVTYQVDEVNAASGRGWTVTAAGPVEAVADPYEHGHYRRVLRGWAHGRHDSVLRIMPHTVHGFRLANR